MCGYWPRRWCMCTGTQSYRTDVINACMDAIGTESGGRTLALGRELGAYVIAADLVGLPRIRTLSGGSLSAIC